MDASLVSDWFGAEFLSLHPLLKALHRHEGKLASKIDIGFPEGTAGKIGRLLATNLGVPTAGTKHNIEVTTSNRNGCPHWDRCFDKRTHMISMFRAVRDKSNGSIWKKIATAAAYAAIK